MNVISVVNRKGGTGKTTIAANLAYELGREGYRVLAIDLDPQTDLTKLLLGSLAKKSFPGIYEVLHGKAISNENIIDVRKNLRLLPGSKDISYFDQKYNESILKNAIADKYVQERFDFIIIDHPPQLTEATLAGYIASDSVVLVTDCEKFSIANLKDQITDIKAIMKEMNPSLRLLGIAVNRVDMRRKLTETNLRKLREKYAKYLFDSYISNNSAIPNSIQNHSMVRELHWRGQTENQFHDLMKEMLGRVQ